MSKLMISIKSILPGLRFFNNAVTSFFVFKNETPHLGCEASLTNIYLYMVVSTGLEPVTSRMWTVRSDQLNYETLNRVSVRKKCALTNWATRPEQKNYTRCVSVMQVGCSVNRQIEITEQLAFRPVRPGKSLSTTDEHRFSHITWSGITSICVHLILSVV